MDNVNLQVAVDVLHKLVLVLPHKVAQEIKHVLMEIGVHVLTFQETIVHRQEVIVLKDVPANQEIYVLIQRKQKMGCVHHHKRVVVHQQVYVILKLNLLLIGM